MKHIIAHFQLRNYWRVALLLLCLGCRTGVYAQATSSTPYDHYTPSGLAPGSPAGVYSLSDFDTINPYNGNLNFRLPLIQSGGRGSAGFTSMLALNTKNWHVRRTSFFTNGEETNIKWVPTQGGWTLTEVGYRPGMMMGRQSGFDTGTLTSMCTNPPLSGGQRLYRFTMTTLTFIAPDGTEYEFRDKESDGKPQEQLMSQLAQLCNDPTALGASRGSVFVTKDGSEATFISDSPLYDRPRAPGTSEGFWYIYPSGVLKFKDGTTYRIDSGGVTWVRDRNGNRVSFGYSGEGLSTITDSLNRQVTFSYNNQDAAPYGLCDRITFTGYGGATRVIRISKTNLGSALRSGYSLQTFPQLFPELNGSLNYTGNHDQQVVSFVWLPDGRYYRFLYNPYGELARVELPTGGAIEYDYNPGSGAILGNNGVEDEWVIFRRVRERRVLPDGATVADRTVYELNANNDFTGQIDEFDSSGTRIASTHHYYFSGSPISSLFQTQYPQPYSGWNEGKEVAVEYLRADDLTPLRRVVYDWRQSATVDWQAWWINNVNPISPEPSNDPRIVSTTTTLLDTNQVSIQTAVNPSSGEVEFDQYNNQTDSWEYDYGNGSPGGLLRHTHTDYLTAGYDTVAGTNIDPNAAATIHIRNLPTSQAVYSDAGTSNKMSGTTYEYDNYTASDGFHAQLMARPSASGLCDGSAQNCPNGPNFTDPSYTTRGNVTKVSRWLNTTGGVISSYQQYDVMGNVVKAIDANGNANTIDFSDNFGSPDDDARQNTPPAQLNGQTSYAFPTKVTNPLGHTAYTQYDYYLGKPVNSEDANGIISSIAYNDALGRPTQGILARSIAGGGAPTEKRQTTIVYDDAHYVIRVTSDRDTFNDNILTSNSYYDGLGRTWRSATYEGSTWSIKDTQFDALNRVSQVSNPYRGADPGSASTPPDNLWTTTVYDSLSRVVQVVTPDNTHVDTAYSGNQVTVTDQAGKKRRSITDALGRLTQVTEDPGGLNYDTYYSYDALGNLLQISQGSQTRTFNYSSLSRLTWAKNPESGPVSYTYDANGNLIGKTDARGVNTTMTYDALNRVKSKVYSGTTTEGTAAANATLPVNYFYDDYSTLPSGAPTSTGTLSKGRLIGVTYGSGSEGTYYYYDTAGRITTNTQQQGTANNATAYTYNLAGGVTLEKRGKYNGSLSSEYLRNTWAYDNAGRISEMDNSITPFLSFKPLATNISYTPSGELQSETYGNGLIHSIGYNERLQPTEIRLGSPGNLESVFTIYSMYGTADNVNDQDGEINIAHNNGNIARIRYSVSGTIQYTQTFQYDALNRLGYAVEHNNGTYNDAARAWYQTFDYDQYGNRGINLANTSDNVDGANTALQLSDFSGANNRIARDGYAYDSSGNLIAEPGKSYTYDGENRLVKATLTTGATSQYVYDGNGRRVKKIVDGVVTRFEYGVNGELISERNDATNAVTKAYCYKGGELIATTPGSGYEYATADHLGSVRAWTDNSGNLVSGGRHDYMPFGEELFASLGTRTTDQGYGASAQIDGQREQFGSKERDIETGLDYFGARYYSNTQGRFTSPDPLLLSAVLEYPQSWNRYAYVRNNPLRYVDQEGLYPNPAYKCDNEHSSCINNEQRRILENSKIKVGDKELSGQALYEAIGQQKNGEALLNAFINITDRLASVKFSDGTNALSQVNNLSGFAPDRIFADVNQSLLSELQNSKDFTSVNAGLHGDYSAASFKDTGVMLGNIQFSFDQTYKGADIDIDIGNIAAKNPFKKIIGGVIHSEEVIQNSITGTKTNQDTVRKLLINNPKVQTITPSPDPKFNRK